MQLFEVSVFCFDLSNSLLDLCWACLFHQSPYVLLIRWSFYLHISQSCPFSFSLIYGIPNSSRPIQDYASTLSFMFFLILIGSTVIHVLDYATTVCIFQCVIYELQINALPKIKFDLKHFNPREPKVFFLPFCRC